jgi:SAM-dependent methyltransferase
MNEGSFRDPAGSLFFDGGHVYRLLRGQEGESVLRFLATPRATLLTTQKRLIGSTILSTEQAALNSRFGVHDAVGLLEHECVPFISYPTEWTASMLHAAGTLTLTCALEALDAGFILKDATPYNVLFNGSTPVFVDVGSFQPLSAVSGVWRAHGQFTQTFLLPLLAAAHGLRPHVLFRTSRNGVDSRTLYSQLSWWRRIQPVALEHVTMPTWAEHLVSPARLASVARQDDRGADPARLAAQLRRLQHQLDAIRPNRGVTVWRGYSHPTDPHEQAYVQAKQAAVIGFLETLAPARILDVGCNEGRFTEAAARHGHDIVAIDQDAEMVSDVFAASATIHDRVLPLIIDLCEPTPAAGWANREHSAFLQRADRAFDVVLALAVLHHLIVQSGAPLDAVVRMLLSLSRRDVVLEWVPPSDPMFRTIAAGRESLWATLTQADVRATAESMGFDAQRVVDLPNGRSLLWLTRR